MNVHFDSMLCFMLLYSALPVALAASENVPATTRVDEFGLPLPATVAGAGAGVATTAAERWKREAVALAGAQPHIERPRALFEAGGQANGYTAFGTAFADAKVPDCLRADGLKYQPPRIAFVGFRGVLALPFVALAKVRGKCL